MVNWTHQYKPLGEYLFVGQNLKEQNDGSTTFDVGTTAFRVLGDQTLQYKDATGICGAILPTWYKDAYVLARGGSGHSELDNSWLQGPIHSELRKNVSAVCKAYAVALSGQPQANEILKLDDPRKLNQSFDILKQRAFRTGPPVDCMNGVPGSASDFIDDLRQIQCAKLLAKGQMDPSFMGERRYALRHVSSELDDLRAGIKTHNLMATAKVGIDGVNTVVRTPDHTFNIVNTKQHYLVYGGVLGVMYWDSRLSVERERYNGLVKGAKELTLPGTSVNVPVPVTPVVPSTKEEVQARRKQQVVELPLF